MPIAAPDLTKVPPRSARVRLGGYVLLPRLLDKCRATILGQNGEYRYNCPLDQRFFEFAGVDAEALKSEVSAGKGDSELLQWINSKSKKRDLSEIMAWSALQEQRAPSDPESRQFFNDLHARSVPQREDISTWFDLLDADDFVSYGGKG